VQNCGLQKRARNPIKKINKKITAFDLHISPLCQAGPAGPIFNIFGVWDHVADVIIPVKFEVDWSRG